MEVIVKVGRIKEYVLEKRLFSFIFKYKYGM